jgi:hypothetical protein
LAIFIINVNPIVYQYSKEKGDWRETGQFLSSHVGSSELIVLIGYPTSVFSFYYSGKASIIQIPDNHKLISNIPKNYTKFWFVPSPDFGVEDQYLKKWLYDHCSMDNDRVKIYYCSPDMVNTNSLLQEN